MPELPVTAIIFPFVWLLFKMANFLRKLYVLENFIILFFEILLKFFDITQLEAPFKLPPSNNYVHRCFFPFIATNKFFF